MNALFSALIVIQPRSASVHPARSTSWIISFVIEVSDIRRLRR